MQNFVKEGSTLVVTAGASYDSGEGVVIGDRAGIAAHDAETGDSLEVLVEGVITYAKTSVAMSVGDKLYFDAADDNVQKTADSGTNKAIGWAASDAASGVTSVQVKLGGF